MRVQELIQELERQGPLKWDKRVSSSQLEMVLSDNQVSFKSREIIISPSPNPAIAR